MKRVSEWETSDGKRFADQTEAKAHEVTLLTLTKLKAYLAPTIQTGRMDAVLGHIVAEYDMIRAFLTEHGRQLPRKKEAVAAA